MTTFQTIDPRKPVENGVHFLPCTILKDGEAKVDVYFEPNIKEEITDKGRKYLSNSLYGRSLKGEKLDLGNDLRGVVYKKETDYMNKQYYKPIHLFDNLTYWKHDNLPEDSDKLKEIIGFVNVLNEVSLFVITASTIVILTIVFKGG